MEEENRKMKKSTKYLLIGTLVLFLSVLGVSVAYYLARVSGNLSGRAAGTELTINVEKLSTNANMDLIPLDNDLETLNQAATGYQDKGACVDINGYSVCQIYHITLTNNGSVPLTVNGTVTLSGQNVPNIDCAKMTNPTTVANNNSCKSGMFVSGDTLAANDHNDYYVMVYIKNLDEPQYDSGEFNGTVTFTTEDGRKVKGRFTKPFNLVQHITKLYNDAEKTVVTANAECVKDQYGYCTDTIAKTIDYNYAINVGLMNDRLGGTTESLDGGNIRYYGETPNNYIDIGDRTVDKQIIFWRIIGVFDGKLRIRRDENIGSYSFDTSVETINDGWGVNQWGPSGEYTGADLMKLINPGYENNKDLNSEGETIIVNNSLWWNSQSGVCYNGIGNKTTECDFTSTGLSNEPKEFIVNQTVYLSAFSVYEKFANEAYTMERGNNIVQNPEDGIERTLSWTGKVGLIYPSDYGYARDFSNENCVGNISPYNDNCTTNWMFKGYSWSITPNDSSSFSGNGISHYDFDDGGVVELGGGWPTLLLDSSVLAESGNGSKETPYVVAY